MKVLIMLATLLVVPALAADVYMEIPGIPGESKAKTDKAAPADASDATADGNSASRIDSTGLHRPPVGRSEGGTTKADVARKCNAKDDDCDTTKDAVEEDENSTRKPAKEATKK